MKLKYGKFEIEFSKEEMDSAVNCILQLERKLKSSNRETNSTGITTERIESVFLDEDGLKSQIRNYIISKSYYEHSTRELLEVILGITGKFSDLYEKDKAYTRAYDRLSNIARSVRKEIENEENGKWRISRKDSKEYGRMQIFRFIKREEGLNTKFG